MSDGKQAYVEHVAIRVADIDWHIRFFREVLGMTVCRVDGPAENPKQVWTVGGLQLQSDPAFRGPEGRLAHLGVMTENLEAALREAQSWGVAALPQGKNWLALPDGLVVELMQARAGSVAAALAVQPRD